MTYKQKMQPINPISDNHDTIWLKEVFLHHFESIWNYAFFLTGNIDIADSVITHSFRRLWVVKSKVNDDRIAPLLYSIVKGISRHEAKPNELAFSFIERLQALPSKEGISYSIESGNKESSINQIISQIPQYSRVVLLMYCIEGFSYNEIAVRLNLSPREVSKRVKEALRIIDSSFNPGNSETSFSNYEEWAGKHIGTISSLRIPTSNLGKDEILNRTLHLVNQEESVSRVWLVFRQWGAGIIALIILFSIMIEWRFSTKTQESPNGKLAYLMLPDSSIVSLNAATKVELRKYGWLGSARWIKLQGEASIKVNNPSQELSVILGECTIKTRNARFNAYFRKNLVKVECVSGNLDFQVKENPPEKLEAGQGISFHPDNPIPQRYMIDIVKTSSWSRGIFYYNNTPIIEVFEEIERQFDVKIIISNDIPSWKTYSGTITNESLNFTLDLVCLPLGLKYSYNQAEKGFVITPASLKEY